ncbi:hypothetical protein acsn021_10260 [Anaerocolumna cellulosilytica]|uniref:Cadherin-like beta-sandwich-like domain-containing protein n=2 Tax=Anaerocolumna cellulosilytica TaxID=433286 RepID=A0A6S6R043_9FIRM|nr:hypothetical protein acsn021_10260 [Anaerocolumna cellulosilytica]
MNLKKYKSYAAAILCMIMVLIPVMGSQAASVTITLTTKNERLKVGEEIIVNLKLSSQEKVGDFQGYVTYNADILEFVSELDFIAGGEGLVKITDTNVAVGDSSRKYTLKFIAKKLGTSEIALKDLTDIFEFESGETMSVSSNQLTIQVEAKEAASNNAAVKSLKINPGKLEPEFNKDEYNYTTKVDNNTKQLIVSAETEDEKATVSITGNEALKEGNNTIKIVVKSEAGNEKVYTITAYREEDFKENGENTKEETQETEEESNDTKSINEMTASIDSLKVYADDKETYIQNGFRYHIIEVAEDVTIPDGYERTTLQLNGIAVTVYTLKNNLESDFLLIYAENIEGEKGFYQYDRKEETIQRFIKSKSNNTVVMDSDLIKSEEYKSRITTMGIVTAILGAGCMILSVALLRVYLGKKDKQ